MGTIGTSLSLCLCFQAVASRFLHSLPEDTYSFPKFRVTFLNGQPLLNRTAQQWLKDGLRGGEAEFLDQPWDHWQPSSNPSRKEIDSGDSDNSPSINLNEPVPLRSHSLELMKLGQKDSYLCFIPSPPDAPPSSEDEDQDTDVSPAHSWSLLQPLSGHCLYHRQGWFTYSYCHDKETRQFRELHTQPQVPGQLGPQEDPEWDSYTLATAPVQDKPGTALSEQRAHPSHLELARNRGARYLVQRWSNGSYCEEVKRHREVEIQFHCSMTIPDSILFVKETRTCSYVLVVQTPRLCDEPGFRSRRDTGEESLIRCREIVDSEEAASETRENLFQGDSPLKLSRPKPVLPAPSSPASVEGKLKVNHDAVMKTFENLLGGGDMNAAVQELLMAKADEGGVIVFEGDVEEAEEGGGPSREHLAEILKRAGFDVSPDKIKLRQGKEEARNEAEDDEGSPSKSQEENMPSRRDEL